MNNTDARPYVVGYLCAIGATILWSGNFIVALELNQKVPPVSLAFWRWLVAVIVFLPFAYKPLLAEWAVLRKNLPYLSITSLLGVTVFNTLIYIGGQTTTAINLSLISITSPIFIVILARLFYSEQLTLYKGTGILLVVIGVTWLITGGRPSSLLGITFAMGDLWMLVGALIFAIYSILIIMKPAEISVRAFQLSTFILGTVFLLPFFIWEYNVAPAPIFDTRAVFSILYLGIFASFISYVLWNQAILIIGASKAGITYYTLPLFSGVLAWIILGEDIGMVHFISGALIVSGVLTANYEQKKNN